MRVFIYILALIAAACIGIITAITIHAMNRQKNEENMKRTQAMREARHKRQPEPEPEPSPEQKEQPKTETAP